MRSMITRTLGVAAALSLVVPSAVSAAQFLGLGDLPGNNFGSQASGVSADGSVVVGNVPSSGGQEAFRWTAATGMVGLGYLPGGNSYSSASGASADGSVVVGYGTIASGSEAYRWTAATGMVGLGALPGGLFASFATGASKEKTAREERGSRRVRVRNPFLPSDPFPAPREVCSQTGCTHLRS